MRADFSARVAVSERTTRSGGRVCVTLTLQADRVEEVEDVYARLYAVPDVLLSGDHEAIRRWRQQESRELTRTRRPDLVRDLVGGSAAGGEHGQPTPLDQPRPPSLGSERQHSQRTNAEREPKRL